MTALTFPAMSGSGSLTVTATPLTRNKAAHEAPMTPPPMMAAWSTPLARRSLDRVELGILVSMGWSHAAAGGPFWSARPAVWLMSGIFPEEGSAPPLRRSPP